ncbi:amidohydrolase family protein [Paenibacillus cremeus]|uniref:Amidohydrolase family protein n=1 Tax=Paenibacillus cremeus TaxID=2163881 RepID=A0A559K535_9BACL|nr:amidohydrolase family protein [Paenibacillus cremeus]TVY07244.1 amidohydrolase family protein [Paenibacillus cremeus]
MYDLVFRKVRLSGAEAAVDVAVSGSDIAVIGSVPSGTGAQEVDGSGLLLLPPFVESHIHLDTVLTAGEPAWNESGTLFEGIRLWQARKQELTREDVLQRAEAVIRAQVAGGILHVRTQADISDPKLTALRALLELRELVRPFVQLQVIAFPQDGLIACPDNVQRLEEAIRLGADGIGAIPHCEPTREAGLTSLDICFTLAAKYNRFVHVFCDELDDGHSRFLEAVAELALRTGLRERVTASHVNATAYYSEAYFQKLLGLLVRSGIHIVSCPLINSAMQGRFDGYPKGRGIARIKELWQAGVNVSIAHDDIRTPFYPLGTGSMLQAAHMAVHLAHMTGREELEEALRMVTVRAADVLQLGDQYGLAPGKPASFILLPGRDASDLLAAQPACRYVVSQGRVVSVTVPARTVLMEQLLFECKASEAI